MWILLIAPEGYTEEKLFDNWRNRESLICLDDSDWYNVLYINGQICYRWYTYHKTKYINTAMKHFNDYFKYIILENSKINKYSNIFDKDKIKTVFRND